MPVPASYVMAAHIRKVRLVSSPRSEYTRILTLNALILWGGGERKMKKRAKKRKQRSYPLLDLEDVILVKW